MHADEIKRLMGRIVEAREKAKRAYERGPSDDANSDFEDSINILCDVCVELLAANYGR